jgi:hypothetical protein
LTGRRDLRRGSFCAIAPGHLLLPILRFPLTLLLLGSLIFYVFVIFIIIPLLFVMLVIVKLNYDNYDIFFVHYDLRDRPSVEVRWCKPTARKFAEKSQNQRSILRARLRDDLLVRVQLLEEAVGGAHLGRHGGQRWWRHGQCADVLLIVLPGVPHP